MTEAADNNNNKKKKMLILVGALVLIGLIAIIADGGKSEMAEKRAQHNQGQMQGEMQGQGQEQMAPQGQGQMQPQGQGQMQGQMQPAGTDPVASTQFVHWWLTQALDYSGNSMDNAHKQARGFIKDIPRRKFETLFWQESTLQGIREGSLASNFALTTVKATHRNPDGSIVVEAEGALVYQMTGAAPQSVKLTLDFQVLKEGDGYRIIDFAQRASTPIN